jgi:hypothetical protein
MMGRGEGDQDGQCGHIIGPARVYTSQQTIHATNIVYKMQTINYNYLMAVEDR